MRSAPITLLTDFGDQDEYVGVMKGVILSINPSAQLVDLCHRVPPGEVERAGRLLAWSWRHFPKGTVHLVVVDPGVGSLRKILCLDYQGQRFLAPDNGVLSLIAPEGRSLRLYAVANRRYALTPISDTFHGRDLLAPAAGYLSKGLRPHQLGPRLKNLKRLTFEEPMAIHRKGLKGKVVALDRFGNAVTNLSSSRIDRLYRPGRLLQVQVKGCRILGLQRSYSAVAKGDPLSIIGSRGLLEIAVHGGSAAQRLRLKPGDPVLLSVR